ncbi:MAG: hypothetical protein JRJ79_13425 [Deltaproteobacteria bacterium]|nr:hypothetical protein [Deltaproteobacteria bacterium]
MNKGKTFLTGKTGLHRLVAQRNRQYAVKKVTGLFHIPKKGPLIPHILPFIIPAQPYGLDAGHIPRTLRFPLASGQQASAS